MNFKQKILFFPKAGIENPYQFLTIDSLNENGYNCETIKHYKFFTLLINVVKNKDSLLYFDWIHMFYLGENSISSLIKSFIFVIEISILRLFQYKFYSTCHNLYPHKTGKTNLNKLIRTYFYNTCTKTRVFDNESKILIQKEFNIPPHKILVIPEGNYIEYYSKIKVRKDTTEKKLKEDRITIGYIGGIKPYKGILQLIEWYNTLDSRKYQLLILGKCETGEYLSSIEEKIGNSKDIVFLNNFIDENKLEFWFNKINIACFPFLKIQNSGSVIMAMGFKKPIISLNKGAVSLRLKNQNQLLYTNSLSEITNYLNKLTISEMVEIGNTNYIEVQKNNWIDIKSLFE